VEHETVAVRGEDERDTQRLAVVQRLLEPVADAAVVVLRFDDRQWDVRLVVEDVIRALGLSASDHLAADDNAALREADFLAKLRDLVPASLTEGRRDELGADVALAELLLVHRRVEASQSLARQVYPRRLAPQQRHVAGGRVPRSVAIVFIGVTRSNPRKDLTAFSHEV
jgi:hypothetical protein